MQPAPVCYTTMIGSLLISRADGQHGLYWEVLEQGFISSLFSFRISKNVFTLRPCNIFVNPQEPSFLEYASLCSSQVNRCKHMEAWKIVCCGYFWTPNSHLQPSHRIDVIMMFHARRMIKMCGILHLLLFCYNWFVILIRTFTIMSPSRLQNFTVDEFRLLSVAKLVWIFVHFESWYSSCFREWPGMNMDCWFLVLRMVCAWHLR